MMIRTDIGEYCISLTRYPLSGRVALPRESLEEQVLTELFDRFANLGIVWDGQGRCFVARRNKEVTAVLAWLAEDVARANRGEATRLVPVLKDQEGNLVAGWSFTWAFQGFSQEQLEAGEFQRWGALAPLPLGEWPLEALRA